MQMEFITKQINLPTQSQAHWLVTKPNTQTKTNQRYCPQTHGQKDNAAKMKDIITINKNVQLLTHG